MYKKLILGSPGTGKTTRLLQITENKLQSIAPEKIAFFSFTKKAVMEAATRASKRFNLPFTRLSNFKTLHALAYRELGLHRNKVLNYHHLAKISKITGLKLTGRNPIDEEITDKGDKFLFLESYARSIKKSAFDVWQEGILDVRWKELKLFIDTYNAYKKEYALMDYTDMLENYLLVGSPLAVDIAIIDEAQDLNPLQWDVVRLATKTTKELYIAGDDDQAIYRWSGADVEQFLSLDVDEKEVLPLSYRLPQNIYHFANNIVKRIEQRYEKNWRPQDAVGSVEFHSSIDTMKFNGEWLILVRSNYQLKPLEIFLREKGYLYTIKGRHSVNEEHLNKIYDYIALQKGKPVNDPFVKKVFDANKEWYEALDMISFYDREYYRSLLRQGYHLKDEPKIHLSTIHGSKGGEADNVLIVTDVTKQVYDLLMQKGDDEHRVFYVAATRAKKQLHILTPQTDMFYHL
jgi:DNA helicase-2/ATP-dependent DNA helicase PcrA